MPIEWLDAPPKRRIEWQDGGTAPVAGAQQFEDMTGEAASAGDVVQGRNELDAAKMGITSMGKGVADVLGTPVDLANLLGAGFNYGGNKLGELLAPLVGDESYEPQVTRAFPGGSEDIQTIASQIAKGVGFETIPEEDMSWGERITDDIVRFGTGGLVSGMGLQSTARQIPRRMGGFTPKAVQQLVDPYAKNAGRTIAGDVAAGMGAGAGLGTYEEVVPEESQGPIGAILSAIAGGGSGAVLKSVGEGVVTGAGRMARDAVTGGGEQGITPDPLTGAVVKRNEAEQAARRLQGEASNPRVASQTIRERTGELDQFTNRAEQPTTGLLSDDVGLTIYDNALRSKEPRPFIERDRAVNTRAREMLDSTAPQGADGRDFTDFADKTVAERLAAVEAELAASKKALEGQSPANPLDPYTGTAADTSRRIDTRFRETLGAEKTRKNQLYNDPELNSAAVDPEPIYDAAIRMEQSLGVTGDSASLPNQIIANIKRLANEVDPETGEVTLKPMRYSDVQDLRAQVSQAMEEATAASGRGASGSGPRVANLRELRGVLDGYIDDLAQGDDAVADKARGAVANYKDNYAPRFKQGQSGAFARDIASDTTGVRTRPEDTANRFLGGNKGDDVESLLRATGDAETPKDARDFMLAKLADTNVYDAKTGSLRPDTLRTFVTRNREALKRVPGMAKEMNDLLAKARDGQRLKGKLADDLRNFEAKAVTDKRKVESGPLGLARDKNPRNAVAAVFNSGDPERQMEALVSEVGADDKARNGLKAAITEYLAEVDTTTALEKTTDGSRPVSFAKLENTFNKHADTLAAVYNPEEMNALRRLHKLLRPQQNRAVRGGVGSDTNEKMQQLARLTEGGLKAYFGVLKGGGIMRSLRLFAESLPNRQKNVDRLITRAFMDPDVAMHLLDRPIADVGTPEWNSKLNRLLAYTAGGREVGDDE